MSFQTALLFFVLVFSSAASVKQPRGIAEEAEEQIQELTSLVQGEILASHNDLDDFDADFKEYSVLIDYNAGLDVLQEFGTINEQVDIITGLATSMGYDVSRCTFVRYEVLQRLPVEYRKTISQCISDVGVEKDTLLSGAKYFIDIIINKVYNLERQLQSCGGDILCISPLVTQMELYKVNLVEDIKKEVQAADDQLTTLKISVKSCSDAHLSDYISRAYSILRDITACVERITG